MGMRTPPTAWARIGAMFQIAASILAEVVATQVNVLRATVDMARTQCVSRERRRVEVTWLQGCHRTEGESIPRLAGQPLL